MEEKDGDLFRETVGNVTPLAEQNRIPPAKADIKARVRSRLPEQAVKDALSDAHGSDAPDEYLANGISHKALRRLKHTAIEDSMDLHGSTVEEARLLLLNFIASSLQNNMKCVKVIHGKGMNSQGKVAVLRAQSRHWLAQHQDVLAFCDAPPSGGGSGAALVLLRAKT